ncbi:MAG: ThiF family adenylyltransferase [Patescibacteria group bacterium]|nr:ThiF family adenylyltransferase [Patescibacteria group bacterium]MCX7589391.1 ThiF family adenylyltransferase [Patescibacteria group bacterium]MDW8279686.1 ThiF family adenylyltransferase [bacterium]
MTKPIIFKASKFDLKHFKKQYKVKEIIDNFLFQLEDYFLISNPKYKFIKDYKNDFEVFIKKYSKNQKLEKIGNWVYFPWNGKLLHILEEKHFIKTKTARNIYLLTPEEQEKFYYQSKIGIAGLSVGSHSALTIAMIGGSKLMKIADNDEISLSNLNRLRYPVSSIGKNKALFCGENIYEMNPYIKLEIYNEGITEKNIEKFLLKPKIDVLIEEMDNLYLKIKIRELAKKYRIPVIMATDHGDNILVDIERYDLNSNYPILHGIIGNMTSDDFKNLKPQDVIKLTAKIAGAELATFRTLYSLTQVGQTIYSWPQLGNAANFCGSVLSYLAKKIILGHKIKEGRFLVDLDGLLSIVSEEEIRQKQEILQKLLKDV